MIGKGNDAFIKRNPHYVSMALFFSFLFFFVFLFVMLHCTIVPIVYKLTIALLKHKQKDKLCTCYYYYNEILTTFSFAGEFHRMKPKIIG